MALCSEVWFMLWYDRRAFGNYFSPLAVLSFPLLAILLLALALAEPLGFRPVSTEVIMLYIVGLPVFWCGSLFWSVVVPQKKLAVAATAFKQPLLVANIPFKSVVLVLSWFVIVAMGFSFINTFLRYGGSIGAIGSDAFAYDYSGSGVFGHILVLGIILVIYLIGVIRKGDTLMLVTVLLLIILILLQQVKTWIYVPLIGGFLLRYYNFRKAKISPIRLFLMLTAVVVLFFLSYYFAVGIQEGDFWRKNYNIFRHFLGYLFAGVLGFGEHMKQSLPVGELPHLLVMPFINLYDFIMGHSVQGVVSNYHVLIDIKDAVDVNVKTLFGTIYIDGGTTWGLIYVFLMGMMLYFHWVMAGLSKNYWFAVLYALMASPLFIGWFDFYYNQLTFVELPVIVVIILFLTQFKPSR
jgi:oligosaccharide repeat unit polymerase